VDNIPDDGVADQQQVCILHVDSQRAWRMPRVMKDVQLPFAPSDCDFIGDQEIRLAKVGLLLLGAVKLRVESLQVIALSDNRGTREEIQSGKVIAEIMGADDKADCFMKVLFNPFSKLRGIVSTAACVDQQRPVL